MTYVEKFQGANINASMINYQNQGITSDNKSLFDLMKYNLIEIHDKKIYMDNNRNISVNIDPKKTVIQK
ncbi:MAG: hypothetical protein AB1414_08350 [bacterium]